MSLFPAGDVARRNRADRVLLRTPFTIVLRDGLKVTMTLEVLRMLRRISGPSVI